VQAIADEDLERETADKTSSVHFVRFELTVPMIAALKAGAALAMGVDHPAYRATLDPVPEATRQALLADLT
jgi:glycerol-3-phosphate dehydrogenase subunit C